MTGRTHLVIGAAAAIAVVQPQSPAAFGLCAAAGAVGGVLPDIDVNTSESHRQLVKLLAVLFLSAAALAIAEQVWQIGIAERLARQTSLMRAIPGCLAFLAVCWFGMHQPHRSFMHSLLALIILTALAWGIAPGFALPFAAAMLSHIALDLLNRRRVRILYPLKRGFRLNLCDADGWANQWLFLAGCAILLLEIAVFAFLNIKTGLSFFLS